MNALSSLEDRESREIHLFFQIYYEVAAKKIFSGKDFDSFSPWMEKFLVIYIRWKTRHILFWNGQRSAAAVEKCAWKMLGDFREQPLVKLVAMGPKIHKKSNF